MAHHYWLMGHLYYVSSIDYEMLICHHATCFDTGSLWGLEHPHASHSDPLSVPLGVILFWGRLVPWWGRRVMCGAGVSSEDPLAQQGRKRNTLLLSSLKVNSTSTLDMTSVVCTSTSNNLSWPLKCCKLQTETLKNHPLFFYISLYIRLQLIYYWPCYCLCQCLSLTNCRILLKMYMLGRKPWVI